MTTTTSAEPAIHEVPEETRPAEGDFQIAINILGSFGQPSPSPETLWQVAVEVNQLRARGPVPHEPDGIILVQAQQPPHFVGSRILWHSAQRFQNGLFTSCGLSLPKVAVRSETRGSPTCPECRAAMKPPEDVEDNKRHERLR